MVCYVRVNSKGKLLCPKQIAPERSGIAGKWISGFALMLCFSASILIDNDHKTIFLVGILIPICLLLLILIEVIRRTLFFLEEWNYLQNRYCNNTYILFKEVYSFEPIVYFACVIITLVLFNTINATDLKLPKEINTKIILSFLLIISATLLISPYLKLDCSPLYTSLNLKNKYGLDYGSGMAHSFFHGYLKIVLPEDNNSDNGLHQLMLKYENDICIKFQTYKLYILIPLSLHCPQSLESKCSPSVTTAPSLDSIKKDRAGVKSRVYKNSVYKVHKEGLKDYIYVCAEYATPLLTFNEVLRSSGKYAAYYRQHKNDIIWNFFDTLNYLINEDPETQNLCELIYYDDKSNNQFLDVGDVLIKKIMNEKLKESCIKMERK